MKTLISMLTHIDILVPVWTSFLVPVGSLLEVFFFKHKISKDPIFKSLSHYQPSVYFKAYKPYLTLKSRFSWIYNLIHS